MRTLTDLVRTAYNVWYPNSPVNRLMAELYRADPASVELLTLDFHSRLNSFKYSYPIVKLERADLIELINNPDGKGLRAGSGNVHVKLTDKGRAYCRQRNL